MHARLCTQIFTAYDKRFIRCLIQNQFPLDWSTAKTEGKRMHGRVDIIKCLKYNFYDENKIEHLKFGAIYSQKKMKKINSQGL